MQQTQLVMLLAYGVVVILLCVAMIVLGYVLGPRHRTTATVQPFESGIVPVGDAQLRFPAQFYLIGMFFVIFDLESVFLYAWAVAARSAGWAGFVEMLIFVTILIGALAYLWRIGALDWAPSRSRGRRSQR
jgi:NADH-quinone oxidoreductase subunit A